MSYAPKHNEVVL